MKKIQLIALLFVYSCPVLAFDNMIGSNGVSGMTFTPTANVSKGVWDYQQMNRNVGISRYQGFNLSSTFGLTESLEIGGRLSANTWTTNQYTGDSGNRHLSASGKFQLNSLLDLQSFPLKVAVGTTDEGGATVFFRSHYAVATLDSEQYQLSAGYAKALSEKPYNTISGLFGSVATSLRPWYTLRLENSDKGAFAGMTFSNESILAKLSAAPGAKLYVSLDAQLSGQSIFGYRPLAPVGIRLPLDATLGQNTRQNLLGREPVPLEVQKESAEPLNAEPIATRDNKPRSILSPNTFPSTFKSIASDAADQSLKSGSAQAQSGEVFIERSRSVNDSSTSQKTVASTPPSEASITLLADQALASNSTQKLPASAVSIRASDFKDLSTQLAKALAEQGFESISVGVMEQTVVLEFSDFVFDHNNLDGAGVALGILSESARKWAQFGFKDYRLVLSKWGTPSLGFSGELACLSNWLDHLGCQSDLAVKPQVRGLQAWLDETHWEIEGFRPYRFKPRIKLNPVQNDYMATEYGVIDYSIGYETQVAIPLWKGGLIEYQQVSPLKSTVNYNDGNIFAFTRVRHGVEHTLLHHVQRLGGGFSIRGTAGQLFTGQFKGYQGELRWESEGGELETGLTSSYWKASPDAGYAQNVGNPTSSFARYAPKGKDWNVELDLGQYWYHDKGASVISNFWFGDTMLSLFLRRSVPPEPYWPGPLGVTFAGFNISFPLTPRKAMAPDFFQVKGASQYGFNIGTPVGRADNYIVGANGIPIYIKALVDAPVFSFLATDVLDHDRMNMSYIPEHLDRLRYAYLRWLKGSVN